MGIVSFSHSSTLSVLLAPVHALAAWFVPVEGRSGRFSAPARARHTSAGQLALPFGSSTALTTGNQSALHAAPPKKNQPSRLRVVREFDSNVGPACAGRMVISGRMADVCAELERMAQREAALQSQ